MNDVRRRPAETLNDLAPSVKELLDDLRPEEVEALRLLVRMGPDGVTRLIELVKLGPDGVSQIVDTVKFVGSVKTVGKFTRALVIFIVGLFVGTVLLARQIVEAWTWIKSQLS
jgi:hypothetical protein